MKAKVYVSAYLVKSKKVNGIKRDVLVLASVDEGDVSQPRPCKQIVIDRSEETKIQEKIEADLNNYIASLPNPELVTGLIHKTHSHGVPLREQYRAMGYRRAAVMGPDPITEAIRFAVENVAEERKVTCDSVRNLKGASLSEVKSFFHKMGLSFVNADEKKALMLALKIKSGSFSSRIEALQKRHDKAVVRRYREELKEAKAKSRVA